jgi:hypothetical protein
MYGMSNVPAERIKDTARYILRMRIRYAASKSR